MMCGQSTLEPKAVDKIMTKSRIGQTFAYAEEIQVGETVVFQYDGIDRTVTVAKVDEDGLEGPTAERNGAYRRYLNSRMETDIEVVSTPVVSVPTNVAKGNELRVRFDEAGEKLLASLSGTQLAELYSKHVALEGKGASFDESRGEVVVKLPEPKKVEIQILKKGELNPKLIITNKNGDKFKIYLFDNDIGLSREVEKQIVFDKSYSSAEQLLEQLTNHLS